MIAKILNTWVYIVHKLGKYKILLMDIYFLETWWFLKTNVETLFELVSRVHNLCVLLWTHSIWLGLRFVIREELHYKSWMNFVVLGCSRSCSHLFTWTNGLFALALGTGFQSACTRKCRSSSPIILRHRISHSFTSYWHSFTSYWMRVIYWRWPMHCFRRAFTKCLGF